MGAIRVVSERQAGKYIDEKLRRRGVVGDPFSKQAVAALTRPGQIAASFGVSRAQIVEMNPEVAAEVRIPVASPEEMLVIKSLGLRVPKTLVTGSQTAALVELLGTEGIKAISKHNVDELIRIAGDEGSADSPAVYLSKLDGDKLVEVINRQNPGRIFRLPTEKELLKIFKELGDQLGDIDYWIWTKDETKEGSGEFVLRHPDLINRFSLNPERRCRNEAVLLVEDIKS